MSLFARCCCFGAILVTIVTSVLAYHFDTDNIILYDDPAGSGSRGSYFGYTVALWNPGEKDLSKSWILTGAPRANTSAYLGVNEPGTVYKCNIGKQCEEWVMDNDFFHSPTKGSWLGGAMDIADKSNPEIVVCASRWTKRYFHYDRFLMTGYCYEAKVGEIVNSARTVGTNLEPLEKVKQYQQTYYKWELGQSGFSIHVIPGNDASDFVLGCPGALVWRGSQISYEHKKNNFSVPETFDTSTAGFDYSGYAVTSGNYFESGIRLYATGVPRGDSFRGKVALFEVFSKKNGMRKSSTSILHGEKIGEYFGAALASCDINGDGKDDLLVGAPQWTKTLDEGRVYSFRGRIFKSAKQFEPLTHVNGEKLRGRFGSAITCLGDIDYDGYADVAVGAPYDGNGAVYIFHGGKNGLTRHSQKIAGPEATKGFGISISKPRDIDNNGYADIAVGAYLSGHVTLIRSKRVVSMTVKLSTDLIGGGLDREAESFTVNVCSTYEGTRAPEELNVTKELKIDEMYERATVEIDGKNCTIYKFNETLKSSNASGTCSNVNIKIRKTANFEYLNPLQLSVSQRLNTQTKNSTLWVKPHNISGDDKFDTSDAVTNGAHPDRVEYLLAVPFKTDCNNDVCRSNLLIEMTTDLKHGTRYVIDSIPPHLSLNVKVHNFGDNAYSAKAYINIPSFIGIFKIPSTCGKNPKNTTHIQIMCQIGNPLAQNETKTLNIDLNMDGLPIDPQSIKFEAEARSSSENIGSGGHKTDLLINSVIEADIGIAGKTNKDWYSFMRRQEEEQVPNIMFKHTYEIKNHEATRLHRALLSVSIPTHWVHANDEIEIAKLNETVGDLDGEKFSCQSEDEASDIHSLSYDAATVTKWLMDYGNSSDEMANSSRIIPQSEKFTNIDGKVFSASPDNRTLYINTTNPSVKWKTINCIIGPFKTAKSTARVDFTFDLLLLNLSPKIMQDKDLIFFATNGSTEIIEPPGFTQTVNDKPDVIMIGTMFVGSKQERQVAIWVIALSVLIGVLLLALLVFGLFKLGFFKRSRKWKLEAMIKEHEEVGPKVVLETSSSTDPIDVS